MCPPQVIISKQRCRWSWDWNVWYRVDDEPLLFGGAWSL